MSRIVRWDPFREMISVRNQMDQLVGDLFREPAGWQGNGEGGHMRLPLDVSEDDNSYGVTASLPGIDPADLPRLTERFYRADKARSRSLGGTGLGLAIVKHIVNRHRGRLGATSTVGQGSRFTVHLPSAGGPPAS